MWYAIKNLNTFSKALGKSIAHEAGFTNKELKKYIKVSNIKGIIKEYAKVGEDGCLEVNESGLDKISCDIFDWLAGVDLAKLTAEGVYDCWWNDKDGVMMFSHAKKNKDKDQDLTDD